MKKKKPDADIKKYKQSIEIALLQWLVLDIASQCNLMPILNRCFIYR